MRYHKLRRFEASHRELPLLWKFYSIYLYFYLWIFPSFLNNQRSGRLYIATLAAKLTYLILGNGNIYCVPLSNLRNSKFLQHKLDLYTKRSPKFRSNTCNGCLRVVYFTRTTIWALHMWLCCHEYAQHDVPTPIDIKHVAVLSHMYLDGFKQELKYTMASHTRWGSSLPLQLHLAI